MGLLVDVLHPAGGLGDDTSARAKAAQWFPDAQSAPGLQRVIVELNSRFITELTHTAATFAELFEPAGRKRLVKVRGCLSLSRLRQDQLKYNSRMVFPQ